MRLLILIVGVLLVVACAQPEPTPTNTPIGTLARTVTPSATPTAPAVSVVGTPILEPTPAVTLTRISTTTPTPIATPVATVATPTSGRSQATAEFVNSSYRVARGVLSGWFETGQAASIMLSGVDLNNSGGPLLFNHPGGIATDGTRLLLADTRNNRILIWNTLPDGDDAPDLVLGQKNFLTNNPGTGLNQLNWPVGVATDGTHVMVVDTENDRILIWNSFPRENAQAAEIVLISDRFVPKRNFGWPWAIWTNGEKMGVAAPRAGILLWNTIPTQHDQPADISIVLDDFGTPRTIGSDGTNLLIGDHNALAGKPATFFWSSFPTQDNQPYDFYMKDPASIGREYSLPSQGGGERGQVLWGPTFTADGKLLTLGGARFYVWDAFPQDALDGPDVILGDTYALWGGDGSAVAVAGETVYLSLSNDNKIAGFHFVPISQNAVPDFTIGSPDIDTNTLTTNFFITNPVPVTNGQNLFVSSDFDATLSVWKQLPDESGAKPDIIYRNIPHFWDNALFGDTLALAGKKDVWIWDTLPLDGEMPARKFEGSIGNVTLQSLAGVALDGTYFYLADEATNEVHVWEGIPDEASNPKFSLTVNRPGRLSSDGTYLAITQTHDHSIAIFRVEDLSSSAQAVALITGPGAEETSESSTRSHRRFNLPATAHLAQGHLFVADRTFHRVVVWRDIEDAISGALADVVLGESDLSDITPEIGRDKVFWPGAPAFGGGYLWLGENKFSGRILRFDVK